MAARDTSMAARKLGCAQDSLFVGGVVKNLTRLDNGKHAALPPIADALLKTKCIGGPGC